ncbi:hypothetical protein [Streptomyces sp. NBC_00306]|uniref:hypothetical protein n=1 Tax=Streptomyces sp. NBC_00306 TaxID=2975708 RepID=UPI002E2E1021|nr:hypothetical protein [Streptomyces sp. NBC_00306]
MDTDQLYPLVMKAVGCAMDKDADGACDALNEIGNSGDPWDMYAACCGFAEVGKAALKKIYRGRVPNLKRGDMWAIQELRPGCTPAADLFAVRFLVAYCNDDADTGPALFNAAFDAGSEHYTESVSALLANVAGLSSLALQRKP